MPWEEPPSLLYGLIAAGLLLALIRGWRRRRRRRRFGVSDGSSLPYGQGLQKNMQRMCEEAPFRPVEESGSAGSASLPAEVDDLPEDEANLRKRTLRQTPKRVG